MQGQDAVAKILKQEGVEYLFCFPHNEIIDAGAKVGIRPILARTERVAINIADGYTRISNGCRNGVCAIQYAAGIENAFAGVAQAFGDATPILLLPGCYERGQLGIPESFQAIYNFQKITKWVEMIRSADRIPQMMNRAFTLLRLGKPGPVMLEIPTDVMYEEIDEQSLQYIPPRRMRSLGDPDNVREVVQMLLKAKSPVIVAGQGLFYSEAWEELLALAELVQVPVMSTINGKSVFPENHPLALGAGGYSRSELIDHFLAKADLIFGIGTSFTRNDFLLPFPAGKTMVQITINEQDVNKDYHISNGVIGDAKAILGQMIEEIKKQPGFEGQMESRDLIDEIRGVKKTFLDKWLPRLLSDRTPISPYRVIWDLMNTVDRRRTIVTYDSGNPRDQTLPFYEAVVPHGFIGWGKTTQLGTGLGLAMGAKLAAPDRLAVNLMGDAAFGMVGMDFETAVRNDIAILTIVFNNGRLGGYDKYLPVSSERYRTRFISGNYSQIGQGLGGYTERVERSEEIVPALKRAIKEVEAGRATLLEVMTQEEPVLAVR